MQIGKQFDDNVEFDFCDNNNPSLKPHINNEDFVGIVGRGEFKLLVEHTDIDRANTVCICIFDPDRSHHDDELLEGFADVLQIRFWDVEEAIGRIKPITAEQGLIIRKFIEKHKDKRFLIHCEAGMSRSAGVGQAVECIKHFDGNVFHFRTGFSAISEFSKKTGRYHPNLTVFDAIMSRKTKFEVGDRVKMIRDSNLPEYLIWTITEVHPNNGGWSHNKGFIPPQDEKLWEIVK